MILLNRIKNQFKSKANPTILDLNTEKCKIFCLPVLIFLPHYLPSLLLLYPIAKLIETAMFTRVKDTKKFYFENFGLFRFLDLLLQLLSSK